MKYRNRIASQPASFKHTVETVSAGIEGLDVGPLSSGLTIVTGIGASYEAAVVTAGELCRRGKSAVAMRAVDLLQAGEFGGAILAISAGGRSVEPVSAIKKHSHTPSFALSREGDNPLAAIVGVHVAYESGPDATPSSTGYTGSLVAAGMLVDRVCGAPEFDWSTLPGMAERILELSAGKMSKIGELFHDRRAIDCVGANSSFGSAGEAALLLREAARVPAWAVDSLHYLHGPMEAMDRTSGVIVFGSGREVKLAEDLAEIGCAVLLVTTSSEPKDHGNLVVLPLPELENGIVSGILEILPAQLLAAELSDAAGLTDTKFRYRQTDTKIK